MDNSHCTLEDCRSESQVNHDLIGALNGYKIDRHNNNSRVYYSGLVLDVCESSKVAMIFIRELGMVPVPVKEINTASFTCVRVGINTDDNSIVEIEYRPSPRTFYQATQHFGKQPGYRISVIALCSYMPIEMESRMSRTLWTEQFGFVTVEPEIWTKFRRKFVAFDANLNLVRIKVLIKDKTWEISVLDVASFSENNEDLCCWPTGCIRLNDVQFVERENGSTCEFYSKKLGCKFSTRHCNIHDNCDETGLFYSALVAPINYQASSLEFAALIVAQRRTIGELTEDRFFQYTLNCDAPPSTAIEPTVLEESKTIADVMCRDLDQTSRPPLTAETIQLLGGTDDPLEEMADLRRRCRSALRLSDT